jgi:hypothetical protein
MKVFTRPTSESDFLLKISFSFHPDKLKQNFGFRSNELSVK